MFFATLGFTEDGYTDIAIVRELMMPIRHGLLAQTSEFTTVASHPQALAQSVVPALTL